MSDNLSALRAQNARLRRLLKLLRDLYDRDGCGNKCKPTCTVCQVSKAVWKGVKK